MERWDQRFYVITGGTMIHVAPHFSVCAPAYGSVGERIRMSLEKRMGARDDPQVVLLRTRMASGGKLTDSERLTYKQAGINHLETNDDLATLVDYLIAQPETRCIVMAAAVCDWKPYDMVYQKEHGQSGGVNRFGKHMPRLQTTNSPLTMALDPAHKIIDRIRKERKDIFLVGFKATAGFEAGETYAAGLKLLKKASANLVFANDVHNHHNMVITPEEFPYHAKDRKEGIRTLAEMIVARTQLDFVRTDVIDVDTVRIMGLWEDGAIPNNFVPVLGHLVESGAFKPFLGKTAGHFGCKVLDEAFPFRRISSRRKVDHNLVFEEGMARIFGYNDAGRILAGGGKPSVGEHTQNQIYERLGDKVHSIVHFHCPLKREAPIPQASQMPFECGSVQCGENTASKMYEIEDGIWAVHLKNHGPNIAFHQHVPPERVIKFIDEHWDLGAKSGGRVG